MTANHQVLFYLAMFDLAIGLLFLRHLRRSGNQTRDRQIKRSVWAIGGLVNLGGLFCGASIVEMLAVFGGLPLVLLLLSDEAKD